MNAPGTARGAGAAELDSVVVTATRIAENSRDLPVSVDRIDAQTIRDGQLQVNLSESLMTVPGVSAQSRLRIGVGRDQGLYRQSESDE